MEVIPAIDLRGGQVVRLYQGDFAQATVYAHDPVAVARRFQEGGAPRLHVVDLDGARTGAPANLAAVRAVVAAVTVPVQVGGGVRTLEAAQGLLALGVARVVFGTAAVRDPELVRQACARFGPEAVVASVDARDGRVVVQGWVERTAVTAVELVRRLQEVGVRRFLYTDVARDGTLAGPNVEAVARLVRETGAAVQASGGVATLEHLGALARAPSWGAPSTTGRWTCERPLRRWRRRGRMAPAVPRVPMGSARPGCRRPAEAWAPARPDRSKGAAAGGLPHPGRSAGTGGPVPRP